MRAVEEEDGSTRRVSAASHLRLQLSRSTGNSGRSSVFVAPLLVTVDHLALGDDGCAIHRTHLL
jgi:hypothetical protein